jgi:aryl-alcohol dehydrogenase-like predicted oxidoreductase
MKLALGTVQFGLDYGISNDAGRVSTQEVERILSTAQQHHITLLDSAAAYGSSEKVIGESSLCTAFNIVTKIPALKGSKSSLIENITQSLVNLQCDSVDALLLHDVNDLISSENKNQTYQQLNQLKAKKLTRKIGVSLYQPDELIKTTEQFSIDVVQLPINCLDQRFSQQHIIDNLNSNNIEVHARSVFLQGLLLMEQNNIPSYFHPYQLRLQNLTDAATKLNCDKLTLALAYVLSQSFIDKILVGCCSEQQLIEILTAYEQAQLLYLEDNFFKALGSNDQKLINPSLWELK